MGSEMCIRDSDYPERELLGATPDDIEMIHDMLMRHLSIPEG